MIVVCPPRISLSFFCRSIAADVPPLTDDCEKVYSILTDYHIDPAFAVALWRWLLARDSQALIPRTRNIGLLTARHGDGHVIAFLGEYVVYRTWTDGVFEWAQHVRYRVSLSQALAEYPYVPHDYIAAAIVALEQDDVDPSR